MDSQSPNHPITQPTVSLKEVWSEPVLRRTPIAESAGSKANNLGDGTDAFSS